MTGRAGAAARQVLARAQGLSPGRVSNLARSTFWLLPSLLVAASVGLAVGFLYLDQFIGHDHTLLLYPGPPSGARSFLSSIVTSMIAVTGTVFSVSIVALQLANGQFSSRIIRLYLRDLVVQITLGLFMATFVYSMLVLRSVGGANGTAQAFVPRIAVTVAFAFVVASVGMFIQYVSHISNLFRVATIVHSVASESRHLLERRYPRDAPRPSGAGEVEAEIGAVPAHRPGVVASVNERRLVNVASGAHCVVVLRRRLGDFVPEGGTLCTLHPEAGGALHHGRSWETLTEAVSRAVALDTERSMEQDLAFGLRQLVDMAEKALSPSLSDPTTAAQCIDSLHDLLRRLASRHLPDGRHYDGGGALRLVVPQYGFSDYLDVALEEISHYGREATQVQPRICNLLDDLSTVALPEHRGAITRWRERVGRNQPGSFEHRTAREGSAAT